MTLLKDFTKEEYLNLRKEHGTDINICKVLFISTDTLTVWKRENGVYAESKKSILDYLTKSKYFSLRKQYKTDNEICKVLSVSLNTLVRWKRENNAYVGQGARKKMSDKERLKIYKKMATKGYEETEIAKAVKFGSVTAYQRWKRDMRKKGIAV